MVELCVICDIINNKYIYLRGKTSEDGNLSGGQVVIPFLRNKIMEDFL